MVRWCW
jgi:hypothetical protein